jgi:hypothetical protein
MAPKKTQHKKQAVKTVVYNDICYVSDDGTVKSRCKPRLHYYVSAWLGHTDRSDDYFDFLYKAKGLKLISLGAVESFESLLRELETDLSKKENDGKLVGDVVILSHASALTVNNQIVGVLLDLPLFSTNDPQGMPRSLPAWDLPKTIDSKEIDKLREKGSDYYDYVDGKGKEKHGLLSKIVPSIVKHLDDSTHVWFAGCNIGHNLNFMKSIRKLLGDKPKVFGFKKYHYISYTWSGDTNEIDGGEEIVCSEYHSPLPRNKSRQQYCPGAPDRGLLWTASGTKEIAKVP